MGGTSIDHGTSVTVDAAGNVYTTGYFNGTVDFDPGIGTYTLTCSGGQDGFVSKLDASGNFIWAKNFALTGTVTPTSISVDGSGNVYSTGNFNGPVDFDPSAATFSFTSTGTDNYISKLDAAGNFVWAIAMGSISNDYCYSLALDASNNVYTTGYFYGAYDFDPSPSTYTLSSGNVFVSKYDAAGNFVWAKGFYGGSGHSISLDASNNIYTTGRFNGVGDFDPGVGTYTLTTYGAQDVFISKLDGSGNFVWAKSIGSTGNDYVYSGTLDALGNIYCTGYFGTTMDFDPGVSSYTITPISASDIFISKLDASGSFVWAKNIGGPSGATPYSITVDQSNNIYTTGSFGGTIDFDPGAGTYTLSAGGQDGFVSKLDNSGNFLWAGDVCSYGTVNAIKLDASNNIYTTGYFNSASDFDPSTSTYTIGPVGSRDIFVSKLSPPCTPPNVTSASTASSCVGSVLNYTITSDIASSYSWNSSSAQVLGGTSGTSSVITNTLFHGSLSPKTITYTITPTSTLGCVGSGKILTVTVYPLPQLTVIATPSIICAGMTSTLAVSTETLGGYGASSYSWSPVSSSASSVTVNPIGNTNYTVLAANSAGCNNQTVTAVFVNSSLPAFSVPGSQTIACGTSSINIIASSTVSSISYSWTGAGIIAGGNSATVTVNSSGAYTIQSTNGCGTNTQVTNVYNGSVPTVTITGGGNFCLGQSKTLTATGTASSYTWMPGGANTNSIIVTPTVTTVYTLTASNGGTCTITNTVQLTANVGPVLSTNASPSTVCAGFSSNLTAAGATTYTWSNGATTNTTVVTPSVTTTYSVIGRSAVGCTTTKTLTVNVNFTPTVVCSNTGTICVGNSSTITAAGASTYTWSTGQTSYSIIVTPTTTTTYSVVGTSTQGCVSTFTSINTVSVNAAPTITVNSGGICFGNSYTLTASGATSYTWNTGAIAASIVVSPTATANYSVVGSTSGGCASTNTAIATVTVSLPPTLAVNSGSICYGNSFTITPSGASTYSYSGGTSVVSPTASATYTITGSNAFGCIGSPVISSVTINAGPTLTISSNPGAACLGKTAILTVSGATTYSWNTGATSSTISVSPSSNTVYSVVGTTSGCSSTKTISVNPIDIVLSASVTNIACNVSVNSGSISLLPGGGTFPYYYSWSNGATTANIKNLAVGSYSVLVSDANGCVDSLQLNVTRPTSLTVNTSIVSPACGANDGQISSTVSGGTAPYTYIWNSGATTPVASSLTPGQYIIQVYDASNCYGSAIVNLNPTNGPVVTIGTTNSVSCYGGNNGSTSISVSGGQVPVTTQWSNGFTSNAISGLPAGVYDVIVTDGSGCKVNQSITINQPAGLNIQPIVTRPNCSQSNGAINLNITGGQAPFTFAWSANAGNATTQNVSNIESGYYNVTIGYNSGCTQSFGIGVSDLTNIAVNVVTVTPSSCTSPSGSIDVTAVNGVPSYSFSWSNGATTEDISNVFPGNYFVTVTDADLCKTSTSVFVPSNIYDYQPEICLISVDTSNNTNYIVWQKNITYGVEKYKIYRESSVPNNFQFVADVPFSALSEYTDLVANADVHSWRYRLSSVDSCGNEIPSYIDHKTIYLDVTFGGTTNNLTWNYYAGWVNDLSKFYISRYDITNGWQLYDSVAANVFTYTDILPPPSGDVRYLVEKKAPFNCIPQLKTAAQSSNKTKSNVKNNNFSILPTKIDELLNNYLLIAPNPAKDEVFVDFYTPITSATKIKVTDVLGKEMLEYTVYEGKKVTIPLNDFKSGLYFIQIQNGNNRIVKKFVKE